MHKHGGIHMWDMTLPDAREAIYVSSHPLDPSQFRTKQFVVVQRHFRGICTNHSLHKVIHSSPLPPGLSTAAMGLLRLGSSNFHDHPDSILRRYYFR